jgi:hypothetical protein
MIPPIPTESEAADCALFTACALQGLLMARLACGEYRVCVEGTDGAFDLELRPSGLPIFTDEFREAMVAALAEVDGK